MSIMLMLAATVRAASTTAETDAMFAAAGGVLRWNGRDYANHRREYLGKPCR